MNLYFRLLYLLLKSWGSTKLEPLDTSVISLRVWLNDLDLNRHMNNGRFLTIMDLGRMDLLKRTGTLHMAVTNKWMPIVGTASMEFLRPLKFAQKYELHSRIYYWDDKWFYLEQIFYSRDKVIAIGKIKGLLRGKSGNISPNHIMQQLSPGITSPIISEETKHDAITS